MWLLTDTLRSTFEDPMIRASAVSAEQQAAYALECRERSGPGGNSRAYSREGSTGLITIAGVLTPQPDFFAFLFGGGNTTYADIVDAALTAEADPKVSDVEFHISSPGGSTDGLFEAIDALAAITKPTKALVRGVMASAAFGLGAQADTIEASSRADQIGSVGVRADVAKMREDRVVITSTEAPLKAPDPETEGGRESIQAFVDQTHELFADAIASGRGTTVAVVNSDFGRGAVLLAGEAVKRGLIDTVAEAPARAKKTPKKITASNGGQLTGAIKMTLEELLAEQPALCATLRSQGYDEGVQSERTRVSAHLTYGEMAGSFEAAHSAISKGDPINDAVIANSIKAAMSKSNLQARVDEDAEVGAGANGASNAQAATGSTTAQADEDAAHNEVLALAANELGVNMEASH